MNYAGYEVEIICLLTTFITAQLLLAKARSNTGAGDGQTEDTSVSDGASSLPKSSNM